MNLRATLTLTLTLTVDCFFFAFLVESHGRIVVVACRRDVLCLSFAGGEAGKEERGADTKTERQLTELFFRKKKNTHREREREEAY